MTSSEVVETSPHLVWFRGAIAALGLDLDAPVVARAAQTAAVTSMLYDALVAQQTTPAWRAFAKSVDAFHVEIKKLQDADTKILERIMKDGE